MADDIEILDFELESIKDSILSVKVIKKDRLNLLLSLLAKTNNVKEHLMYSKNGKTLVRKLARKMSTLNRENSFIVDIIYSDSDLFLEALKGDFNSTLYYAPNSVFSMKHEGNPILDTIFEKNNINGDRFYSLLKFPNVFKVAQKYNFDFSSCDYLNKYLLEEKDGKLMLDDFLEADIDKSASFLIYNDALIEEILNRKAYYLLKNVSLTKLARVYAPINDKTLLEILYDNDMKHNYFYSKSVRKNFFNSRYMEEYLSEDIIKIILKYGKHEDLKFISSESLLLIKLDSGKCLFEELADKNILLDNILDIGYFGLVDIIINKELSYYYNKINTITLLRQYDLNNTYLDVILSRRKKDSSIKFEIEDSIILTEVELLKIAMIYAKHGLLNELNFSIKDLLRNVDGNGKTILDSLLEYDKENTLKYVISDEYKNDKGIQLVLGLHDIKHQCEVLGKTIEDSIIQIRLSQYESGEVGPEYQELLNEFYNVMDDGKSSMDLVDTCILSYKRLFYLNNPAAYDIIHLIELKKKYPMFHMISKKGSHNALYDISKKEVVCDPTFPNVLMHELAHVLHNLLNNSMTPVGFNEILENIVSQNKNIETEHYADLKKLVQDIRAEITLLVNEKYDEVIDESFLDEIKEFLNKGNFSKKIISQLLSNGNSENIQEYIKKDKKVKVERAVLDYLISVHVGMSNISDIIDAITSGNYTQKYNAKKSKIVVGHGVLYYTLSPLSRFEETFANYIEIIKSPNSDENIKLLRQYVGDELVDFLQDYYHKNYLNTLVREDNHVL